MRRFSLLSQRSHNFILCMFKFITDFFSDPKLRCSSLIQSHQHHQLGDTPTDESMKQPFLGFIPGMPAKHIPDSSSSASPTSTSSSPHHHHGGAQHHSVSHQTFAILRCSLKRILPDKRRLNSSRCYCVKLSEFRANN